MIGKQIGPYVIEETIGAGAMSTVFRARAENGAAVALKILHGHLADGETRERFVREAKVLATLADPRCVKILRPIVEESGQVYTVLEYVEGQSLAEFVREQGTVPPLLALFLVREILYPLIEAHEKGIVHRDLKPENILIGTAGEIKVADFGLARLAERTGLTRPGAVIGSPAFMPPEQVLGKKADGRADLFSLGVIHYNLLSGRLLFEGKTKPEVYHSILNQDHLVALRALTSLDADYVALLARCLAKDREERFPTARDFSSAIDDYLDERGLGDYRPALTSYLRQPRQDAQGLGRLLAEGPLRRGGGLLGSGREREALPLLRKGLELAGYLETPTDATARVARRRSPIFKTVPWGLGAGIAALMLGLGFAAGRFGERLRSVVSPQAAAPAISAVVPLTPVPLAPPAAPPKKEEVPALREVPAPLQEMAPSAVAIPAAPAPSPEPRPPHASASKKKPSAPAPQLAVAPSSPPAAQGDGFVTVRTTPWAYVFVDGKFFGETPFEFPLALPAGQRRLTLKNPYCQTSELSLDVRSGQMHLVEHRLTILPATLRWKPGSGYRMWIDEREAQTPELSLSHGLHQLRILTSEGRTLEKTLEAKAGKRLQVSVGENGIELQTE